MAKTFSPERRLAARRSRLSADSVGRLTHAVLASMLGASLELSDAEVRREVDRQLPDDLPRVYRQSLRQHVGSAITRYRDGFLRSDWQFLYAEAIRGDVALDLLWRTSDDRLVADEIKTGAHAEWFLASIKAQAMAQLLAGRNAYGQTFASVRVVLLASNRAFSLSDPSGTVEWIT